MINLPTVTMVCIDTKHHAGAMKAIRRSLEQIQPAKTIFFTDIELPIPGVYIGKIDALKSKEDYSRFVVKELCKWVFTEHVLIIQHDGYVLDGKQWSDEFLQYDYIGAPWPYNDNNSVGNGGFSLRSKELMYWLRIDQHIAITHPEDEITCRLYGKYLETVGYKFAPVEVAQKFSYELIEPLHPTFGFHQYYHQPYRPHAIVTRQAAAGDVIMTEPLLERLWNDGYQPVLDTPIQFWEPFKHHRFPVKHITQTRIELLTAPGVKFIGLDMAYESKPQQPVLKSYYEAAGIEDGEMKNSQLTSYCPPHAKLFGKYAVVHIDDTDMPWRNIAVSQRDWLQVFAFLTGKGYMVLQVGKGAGKQFGTHINTHNYEMLNYMIGGADIFIGTDSFPLQVAIALGVKCIGFFGSVTPELRYSDFDNLSVIQGFCVKQGCYHSEVGTRGVQCLMGDEIPRCTQHTAYDIVEVIKSIL